MKKPYPVPKNESKRLEALNEFQVLDTSPEEEFDRITRLAAKHFDVPIALISLVDESRQWFKSRHGLEASETPKDIAFCAHTICGNDTMVVPNALEDTRFADTELVVREPNIRFYAGSPLTTKEGHNIGTLCLIDTVPRSLTEQQIDFLKDLSRIALSQLELRLSNIRAESDILRNTHNIELLRDNQAKLNAIFNSTLDAILILDEHGRVNSYNAAAESLFRYSSSELLGTHAKSLMPDSFELQAGRFFENYSAYGTAKALLTTDQDLYGVRKDGSRFPMELSIATTKLNGTPSYVVVIRDMTSHKRSERALLNEISNTEKLNTIQAELLARISHEFKTPLNAILGFSDILNAKLSEKLSTEDKSYFDQLINAGNQLSILVNRVVEYTKVETAKYLQNSVSTNVLDIVNKSWETIQPIAARRNISLVIRGEESLPTMAAYANPDGLEQAISQILSNAVKFNKDDGVIEFVFIESEPDTLAFSISDQGDGIPKEEQERIFDLFARARQHEFAEDNLGIGLSLCRAILLSMNGSITLTSEPGTGSCFTVTLPTRDVAANSTSPPESDSNSSLGSRASSSIHQTKVLLIDDDISLPRQLEAQSNIHLLTATRGQLGYVLALQHKPDLIILSLELPDGDGMELLSKLAEHAGTAQIPLVILGEAAMDKEALPNPQLRVVGQLSKPVSAENLQSEITKAISRTQRM